MKEKMNMVFVFADQWRAGATGYAGDPNVITPNLDRFSKENLNFTNAVSGCPVCSPYRASLMTGVYPHKHGMVVNDQCLHSMYSGPYLAECLRDSGFDTAYIGKWHIDGNGRKAFVPPERRLGFDWWKGYECTHDYNNSFYYSGDDPNPRRWPGYDAEAQTGEACRFLKEETGENPFALFLSWGPPHNPFETAPEKYKSMYDSDALHLPPNVPEYVAGRSREELAGFYSHCSALDNCFGRILSVLEQTGLDEKTIVIFTSDHGDMLGSQGTFRKQRPWAESARVPFLIRHPKCAGPGRDDTPVDAPDIMPSILSLCGVPVPASVQGRDFSSNILRGEDSGIEYALLAQYRPFHEWRGGCEYRGLHGRRYTYVRTLDRPWLLYDNLEDPFQKRNLINDKEYAGLASDLEKLLMKRLLEVDDDFPAGEEYIARWDIKLNVNGDVAYT